jgi:flagellar FliL protein
MSVSTMATTQPTPEDQSQPGRSRKLLVLVTVLLLAGAASWFYLRPAEADEAPQPGAVLQLEPIQLNLASGRYLRVGIALQGVADAHEELEGSKALDATIELFSGRRIEDLAQPVQRQVLKKKLRAELIDRYHGEVIDVYFTDFVTQ